MWNIVYADGVASEVEIDVMWRVADLIGIKAEDRDQIETRVQAGNISASEA